ILTENVVNAVITEDYVTINRFVTRLKEADPDILHIVVYDKHNAIIGHTFEKNRIPTLLRSPNTTPNPQLYTDKDRHILIRQYTNPLFGGKLGYVTLGLNDTAILNKEKKITFILSGMIFLFLIFGIAGAIGAAYFVTQPVYQILEGVNNFDPGKPLPEINIYFNDEMMLLKEGVLAMMERITAQDQADKITQAKIVETEKLASIGILASGVAHEINNPVAGIELCAYRLLKHPDQLDEKVTEYVHLIAESANHIKDIVNNLLDYAHQNAFKHERFDLRGAITFALRLVQYRLEKNQIQLTTRLPETPVYFMGAKGQLAQVIVNCILNSIDAMGKSGEICIELHHTPQQAKLQLQDNGKGMSREVLNHIFDPFYTTKGNKGTGLGMYVSYNIITTHGGTIFVDSLEKKGTTVTILLPLEGGS
ncbi:MAG: sensor histidine kinase, partial [Gemmatimonadetes bacterium]